MPPKAKKQHKVSNNKNNRKHETKVSDATCFSENQKKDPKTDLPYKIVESDIMGRYLVAARDLKPGEIIITEKPLAVGPCMETDAVCLGCYHPVSNMKNPYKCSECKWPLCRDCIGLHTDLGHSLAECNLFKTKKVEVDISFGEKLCKIYEVILPMRCLLLKVLQPDSWSIMQRMENHNEARRNRRMLWNKNQQEIVDILRIKWGLTEYSEEEIHSVCGMLEVNSFEIGSNALKARARAIYPTAFLLSHNCIPNTIRTENPRSLAILIRASTSLKQGQPIFINYAYTFQGTLKRREHLLEGKFFLCTCQRCSDPTEFETYSSAIICTKCTNGSLLPVQPLSDKEHWRCGQCDYSISPNVVSSIFEKVFLELDQIDPHDVLGLENFLNKYATILHENNYLLLGAKYNLCQILGRIEGFLIHQLSDVQLQKKVVYCRDLLNVLKVLEPGISRTRGVIQYELHAPLIVQAKSLFESNRINRRELRQRIREVIQLLKESEQNLSFEPEGTSEYEMAAAGRDALKHLVLP